MNKYNVLATVTLQLGLVVEADDYVSACKAALDECRSHGDVVNYTFEDVEKYTAEEMERAEHDCVL